MLPPIACPVPTVYVAIECKTEDAKYLSCTQLVQMVFFEIGNLENFITTQHKRTTRTMRSTIAGNHVEFRNSHRDPINRSRACPVAYLYPVSSTQTAVVQQECRQSREVAQIRRT